MITSVFLLNGQLSQKCMGVPIHFCVYYDQQKNWIINFINDKNMLNKKSELISKCRHLNKHLLRNVKKK